MDFWEDFLRTSEFVLAFGLALFGTLFGGIAVGTFINPILGVVFAFFSLTFGLTWLRRVAGR